MYGNKSDLKKRLRSVGIGTVTVNQKKLRLGNAKTNDLLKIAISEELI